MCEPSPVKAALAKVSMKELESAIGTARQRSADADDSQTADLFRRIADEMSAELESRALTILTNAVLKESQEQTQQMRDLVSQMTS